MPSTQEKIALVEAYIFHRKEVAVQINVQQFDFDVFAEMRLNQAYNYAYNWFANNNGKVEILR